MKTLNFVIPVYNEEKRLNKTFKALEKEFVFDGIKLKKIIFVDDGSTDKTLQKLQNAKKTKLKKIAKKIQIISYENNMGKGYAVKQGMLASKSDYTLFFDADMSTPLSEFAKLIPYIKKNFNVIIGTRKNGHSTVIKHQPFYRELLGKGFTLLSNIILNTWVTDFTCGFKLFSKRAKNEVFKRSFVNRWGYDAEIMYLSKNLGYEIHEKAVVWSNDEKTKVNLLIDIPQTISDLIKIRISHNYHFAIENINSLLPKRLNLKIN